MSGDLGFIDAEGFLTITGRVARFSKIAGEMIPHERVEQALAAAAPDISCVVTSVPDAQRGERLIVLCASGLNQPTEVAALLAACDLPKLWLPKRDSFFAVDSIPMLATGKTDLGRVRDLALALVAKDSMLPLNGSNGNARAAYESLANSQVLELPKLKKTDKIEWLPTWDGSVDWVAVNAQQRFASAEPDRIATKNPKGEHDHVGIHHPRSVDRVVGPVEGFIQENRGAATENRRIVGAIRRALARRAGSGARESS